MGRLLGNFIGCFFLAAGLAGRSAIDFVDPFEVESSSSYSLVTDGLADGTVTFAYDYVAQGIPAAPHSNPGDRHGLRMTVNDARASTEAFTLFWNNPVNLSEYTVEVDVYMGYSGFLGSTEFATVGVGGSGVMFNQFENPTAGSGVYASFSGDGGSQRDFTWYRDASVTPPGDPDSGLIPTTHPSYNGHGSDNSHSFFQGLFPGGTNPGAPGNLWTTLGIQVRPGQVEFLMDGQTVFQGSVQGSLPGLISLGLVDVFASVDPGTVFTLFDNLRVQSAVPEPSGAFLLIFGGVVFGFRHRYRLLKRSWA